VSNNSNVKAELWRNHWQADLTLSTSHNENDQIPDKSGLRNGHYSRNSLQTLIKIWRFRARSPPWVTIEWLAAEFRNSVARTSGYTAATDLRRCGKAKQSKAKQSKDV